MKYTVHTKENLVETLTLTLPVTDPESLGALYEFPEEEQVPYALDALNLGIRVLNLATVQLDQQTIRDEANNLMGNLKQTMTEHADHAATAVETIFKQYLDPSTGVFNQRLNNLTKKDGELATVLSDYLEGDDSEIAHTLAHHIGENSPLFKKLDPEQKESLVNLLTETMAEQIADLNTVISGQFSLDDEESAISRFLGRITNEQGKLLGEFQEDMERLEQQFSLDDEDSALSYMARIIKNSTTELGEQFSLDEEGSALSRMKKALEQKLTDLAEEQHEFHIEIRETLAKIETRKSSESGTIAQGLNFEDFVGELICACTQEWGDLFDAVGAIPGKINRNKKGDFVATHGPDSLCAGRAIVFEAKADKSYGDVKAIEELHEAKKNRGADIGVFVMSSEVANPDTKTFRRIGNDLFIIIDPEDRQAKTWMEMAYSVSRALMIQNQAPDTGSVDIDAMVNSCLDIEKQANDLDKAETWSTTIINNAGKISKTTAAVKKALLAEVEKLQAQIKAVEEVLDADS
jgi:hypothetical protein